MSKAEFGEFLASAQEHAPDAVLLIVTGTLSSNLKDWVDAVRCNYQFDIFIGEEKDLQREIAKHKGHLSIEVAIVPTPGAPTVFYRMQPGGPFYMSDSSEFEELGFYLLNDYGPQKNAEYIRQFIEYIRNNEIDINIPGDDT